MTEYVKLNREPIGIEYVPDETDSGKDFEPSFMWRGQRHYTSDFVRCHNNPYISDVFPEYIHGYEVESYYGALFVEIVSSEEVNVYERVNVL